jgi:hypothetical protein
VDIQRNTQGRVARVMVIETDMDDGWVTLRPPSFASAEPAPQAARDTPTVIEATVVPTEFPEKSPAASAVSKAELAAWVERLRAPTPVLELSPPRPDPDPPRRVPDADILVLGPRSPARPALAGGSVVAFRAALHRPGSAPRLVGLVLLLLAAIGGFALNLANRGAATGIVVPATLDEKSTIT